VYVSGEGEGLYALDPATGDIDWSVPIPVSTVSIAAGGRIYVGQAGSETGRITALSSDGEKVWSFAVPAGRPNEVPASPAVVEETLYAVATVADSETRDRTIVYALDTETGDERWTHTIDGKSHAAPAASETTVYVTTDAGAVHAIDRADGETDWVFGNTDPIRAAPAIVGDSVIAGGVLGTVYALEADTGVERWHRSTEITNIDPTASGDVVYIGGSPLYALSVEDGDLLWEYGLSAFSYTFYSPTITDNSVYVGSCVKWEEASQYDNGVYKLSAGIE